jgi:hypothetical protein
MLRFSHGSPEQLDGDLDGEGRRPCFKKPASALIFDALDGLDGLLSLLSTLHGDYMRGTWPGHVSNSAGNPHKEPISLSAHWQPHSLSTFFRHALTAAMILAWLRWASGLDHPALRIATHIDVRPPIRPDSRPSPHFDDGREPPSLGRYLCEATSVMPSYSITLGRGYFSGRQSITGHRSLPLTDRRLLCGAEALLFTDYPSNRLTCVIFATLETFFAAATVCVEFTVSMSRTYNKKSWELS